MGTRSVFCHYNRHCGHHRALGGGLVNPGDLMTGLTTPPADAALVAADIRLDALPQTLIGLLPGNPPTPWWKGRCCRW